VLGDLRQEGCLKIRFPRGRHAEAVLLNTSGGVAGGDRLQSAVSVGDGAHATISTQAAERFYRALPDDPPALVRATLTLAEHASLNWLPQETILFDRCAMDRQLDVALAGSARFLGIETLLFGRTAMGEIVRRGQIFDRIRIRRDEKLVFQDAIRLQGAVADILARPATAGGQHAVATLVLVAPDAAAYLEKLRAALAETAVEAGASAWDGMLVARVLAPSSLLLRRGILAALAALGRPVPRVWGC